MVSELPLYTHMVMDQQSPKNTLILSFLLLLLAFGSIVNQWKRIGFDYSLCSVSLLLEGLNLYSLSIFASFHVLSLPSLVDLITSSFSIIIFFPFWLAQVHSSFGILCLALLLSKKIINKG